MARSPRRARLLLLTTVLAFVACGGESVADPLDDASTATAARPRPSITMPTPTGALATASPTPATSSLVTPSVIPSPTVTATPSPTHVPATVPPDPPSPPDDDAPVIVLDPGHDVAAPSALGIEYQDTLRSARFAKAALEAAGYRVFLTRESNDVDFRSDPSLLPPDDADFMPNYGRAYAHATKALQFEPDMVIQLHFNGHNDPNVARLEVYYCELGGPQNLEFAEIVRAELVEALRSIGYETPSSFVAEDLGVARGNRHFPSLGNVYDYPRTWLHNRFAGIPVVLTEPLYETNATERALIQDDATMIALARAYVRAADRWFGR